MRTDFLFLASVCNLSRKWLSWYLVAVFLIRFVVPPDPYRLPCESAGLYGTTMGEYTY